MKGELYILDELKVSVTAVATSVDLFFFSFEFFF